MIKATYYSKGETELAIEIKQAFQASDTQSRRTLTGSGVAHGLPDN